MSTPMRFVLASIALYVLAQVLPAAQGQWNPGDLQLLHFYPSSDETVAGWKLTYAGLEGFLFLGIGFHESSLAETCWLANAPYLLALVFFAAKKPRTAAWLAGFAQIAALLILVPSAKHGHDSGTLVGSLEIGYWCWLASIATLLAGSVRHRR